jgi:bacterioferritin-associated ferredoxin
MIVCLCRGVADHVIRATIARGGDTRERLVDACGAGTDCGSCVWILDAMLDEVQGADYAGRARQSHLTLGGSACGATSRSSPS